MERANHQPLNPIRSKQQRPPGANPGGRCRVCVPGAAVFCGYWEFSCASISAVLRQGPQAPLEHNSRPTKQFWTVPCWPSSIRHSRTCLSVQGVVLAVEVATLSVDVEDAPARAELAGEGAGGGVSSLPQAPSMGATSAITNVSRVRTNLRIMHKTPTSNNDTGRQLCKVICRSPPR